MNDNNLRKMVRKLFYNQLSPDLTPPTDVIFKIGESNDAKEIPAHKFLLSLRSPVFHSMFNSSLAETSNLITLVDVDPIGFMNMLR